MMPTIIEAEKILEEDEQCNLGSWKIIVVSRHTVLKKLLNYARKFSKNFSNENLCVFIDYLRFESRKYHLTTVFAGKETQ